MTSGQLIRAARKKAGLSQKQLAEKLELPYQSIGQWENGARNPRLDSLKKIAHALDIPLESLLDRQTTVIIPGRLRVEHLSHPELDDDIMHFEATDAEAAQIATDLLNGVSVDLSQYSPMNRILAAIDKLSPVGISVAVERIEELARIPEYQRKVEDTD